MPLTPRDTNKANIIAAKNSSAFGAAILQTTKDLETAGCVLFMQYDNGTDAFSWGYTDSFTHVTSYWQAFLDFKAAAAVLVNPISGIMGAATSFDGRLIAGFYGTRLVHIQISHTPYNGLHGLSGNGSSRNL